MSYQYETISCRLDKGVLFATLSSPPMNVMNPKLFRDLLTFTKEVEDDGDVRALVLASADPDFFIAHFDLEMLIASPIEGEAVRSQELNAFHLMCERVRTMPKATIAKIAGLVGGCG